MDDTGVSSNTRVGDWQCPNDQCINHTGFPQFYVYGTKVNCSKCGTGKSATRPGDWCCPNPGCVNHQNTVYGSKATCSKCGQARPALNARGHATPNPSPNVVMEPSSSPAQERRGLPTPRPGDWHCPNASCKNHTDNVVFANKSNCPVCGEEKPENAPTAAPAPRNFAPPPPAPPAYPQQFQQPPGYPYGMAMAATPGLSQPPVQSTGGGRPEVRAGDWNCPNISCKNFRDNVVYGSKSHCPICHTPKPAAAASPAPAPMPQMAGGWPQQAMQMGQMGYPMGMYQAPPPPPQPPQYQQSPVSSGYGPLPGRATQGLRGNGKGQPGDWHCPNVSCKNHTDNVVYASKALCPICQTPKPNGGDASVSFTTARPGDWQCPNTSCKNHVNGVYGSKPICTICGETNPNNPENGLARERSRSPHRQS